MPECNLYNSPIMNLQQIWCLTSDIKMQAIAFENFSKMFLRSILMTPDLLPLATFIKKKKKLQNINSTTFFLQKFGDALKIEKSP